MKDEQVVTTSASGNASEGFQEKTTTEPHQVVTMAPGYVKPGKVLSPKDRVNKIVEVLWDGGEDSVAVAILDYSYGNGKNNSEVVAIRWNGSNGDPLGFPSVRQYPVWFLVPDELASTIKFLASHKFPFQLPIEKSNADKVMTLFGNRFSTESLMKELKQRGFKVTLEM